MRQSFLDTHRQLLRKWRKAMDLIGPGDMEAHFIDAIKAVESLDISGDWIDLGSGAGFPGIALGSYHPQIHLTMVESRQKRATFLKQIVLRTKIPNITIICDRTENITQKFDGVISRAYKPPLEYLEDAKRLLKPNGTAICLLGDQPNLVLPSEWKIQEQLRYPVSDGYRQRWSLTLSSE
jgi:16S rRNA (guanine527-N7)-methyltransferase